MRKNTLLIIISIILLIGFTACDPVMKSIAEGTEALDPATDAQVHEKYFDIDGNGLATLKENQTDLPVSLLIPEKVGDIAVKEIANCTGPFETVRIPGHVKRINEEAFFGCTNLVSVVIEDGVEFIGEDAFGGCVNLTQVVINASTTFVYIDDYAFPFTGSVKFWLGTQEFSNLDQLKVALDAK